MTKPKRQMPLLRGGTDGLLTHRWSGMDSNVQFRAINSSWLRLSWGRSTGARSSEQFGDLGEPIDLSGGSGAAPLTARIRRRHTKVALSAVQAHRGSKGSNPFPSSTRNPAPL